MTTFDVLLHVSAERQVGMRGVDAAVDDGHADAAARVAEARHRPLFRGADQRRAFMVEVAELFVEVDRADARVGGDLRIWSPVAQTPTIGNCFRATP